MCAGGEPGCCLCTAHTHRVQRTQDHEEMPMAHLGPRRSPRLHCFIQPRSILFQPIVKSCFSFPPIDMGMFPIGKQKHQGRHCWALPSAEPPTRASVWLCGTCWELKPPLHAHPSVPARSHAHIWHSCFAKLSSACWEPGVSSWGQGRWGRTVHGPLLGTPAHPEGQEG